MLALMGYILIGGGALATIAGYVLIHRKAEAEISQSLGQSPLFIGGVFAMIAGLIMRIIATFI